MPEIRPLDLRPAALADVSRFLRAVFPHAPHLDPAYLAWLYVDNPDGPALGHEAFEGERRVGHFAAIPFPVRADGAQERSALVVHVSTAPEYRRKRLYIELFERSMQVAADAGFDLLVGIANAMSAPGPIRHLGWEDRGTLDVRLGIGSGPAPDPAVPIDFERTWTPESLRWRLARPGTIYTSVRRAHRARVYAPAGRLGIHAELGWLPEGWLPERMPPLRSIQPLHVWLGLDPRRDWSGSAWAPLPVRLRPAPLHFLYCDLRGRRGRLTGARLLWRGLDFDAY